MSQVIHLAELTRQVRSSTLELLNAAAEPWLTWAPEGTSNHILWHSGHALWLQDALCIQPLTGASELPEGWAETFGMRCRPVRSTTDWPDRDEVYALLEALLDRMLALFRTETDRLTQIGPDTPVGWNLMRAFKFTDVSGRVRLVDKMQGKFVLLHVWATWCAPCIESMPTIKRRQRSAAGRSAGSHSVLIVPSKLANGFLSELAEGSETPDQGTVFENHDGCLEIRPSCHRNRNG